MVLNCVASIKQTTDKSTIIVLTKNNLDNEIVKNLKEMQCDVIFKPPSHLFSFIFIIRYIATVSKYERKILLSYDFRSNFVSWLLTLFCHVKWCPAIHGLEAAFVPWRKNLLKFILQRSQNLVVPSQSVAKKVKKFGIVPDEKIQVIYNAVDTRKVVVKKTKPQSKTINLVCVGNFYLSLKGQHIAIEALKYLHNGYTLTFIGDGPLKLNVIELAKSYNLQNRVKFLGLMSHQEIMRTLHKYDILIVPSESEAFGIVAIEGMAVGLPVIASDVGGLPEIITKSSGILFDINDHKMFYEAISEISQDIKLWNKLHLGALRRSEDFSIKKMLNKYIELVK